MFNDKWRVAHAYSIPIDLVVDAKVGFGTEDEIQMAEIFRKRRDAWDIYPAYTKRKDFKVRG
jgi:hypothetical protein